MLKNQAHRFAVAPMMGWTNSACRVLHRCLTKHALLYSEMITADAVVNGDRDRLLAFEPFEKPVALQLGGSDPKALARASSIAADFGYDEVNLNVGCPSDRVQSGRFGACLMREPVLVGECVAAMRASVSLPVTVKCRIGVDEQDPYECLHQLIGPSAASGVSTFIVHARKAWLNGLSPKENREIPPLDYQLVYGIKREYPDLTIILNGGIRSLDEAEHHLSHIDGVMLGRTACENPSLLADVDRRFFGGEKVDLESAVDAYCEYVEMQLRKGARLQPLAKPMLGLYSGRPGSRMFRRHLSENAARTAAGGTVLREALCFVRASQLA